MMYIYTRCTQGSSVFRRMYDVFEYLQIEDFLHSKTDDLSNQAIGRFPDHV